MGELERRELHWNCVGVKVVWKRVILVRGGLVFA